MVENLQSKMWNILEGKIERVDGRTAFIAANQGDETAQKVIEQFVGYLSEGIADFVNILRPEAIVLGGGIANEGELLFELLRKAVNKRTYIAMDIVPLKIVGAKLGNRAGVYPLFLVEVTGLESTTSASRKSLDKNKPLFPMNPSPTTPPRFMRQNIAVGIVFAQTLARCNGQSGKSLLFQGARKLKSDAVQ